MMGGTNFFIKNYFFPQEVNISEEHLTSVIIVIRNTIVCFL